MASAYQESARVFGEVVSGRASLKEASFRSKHPGRCLALVGEALKRRRALESALRACAVRIPGGQRRDEHMLILACFDAVAGRGLPKGGGVVIRSVRSKAVELKEAFDAVWTGPAVGGGRRGAAEDEGADDDEEKAPPPRYVRCNPLRPGGSVAAVREALGAEFGEGTSTSAPAATLVVEDAHIGGLLSVPRSWTKTLNGSHPLVGSGRVVLQDKASCFPAQALMEGLGPAWRGDVLDACAAPGNKTTHAAALLAGRGTVVALDRDPKRVALLRDRVAQAGAASIVEARQADFLQVQAGDVPRVRLILLDPSCSGSGIAQGAVEHAAHHQRDGGDGTGAQRRDERAARRVTSLAAFQLAALKHALGDFPAVERVAYSTCSVHDEENEAVVAEALRVHGDAFELRRCLPTWPRRGLPHQGLDANRGHDPDALVRADPALDETHGFFVALFVRRATTSDPAASTTAAKKRPRAAAAATQDADKYHGPASATGNTNASRNAKRKLKRLKAKARRQDDHDDLDNDRSPSES